MSAGIVPVISLTVLFIVLTRSRRAPFSIHGSAVKILLAHVRAIYIVGFHGLAVEVYSLAIQVHSLSVHIFGVGRFSCVDFFEASLGLLVLSFLLRS